MRLKAISTRVTYAATMSPLNGLREVAASYRFPKSIAQRGSHVDLARMNRVVTLSKKI
jgi:hypothetical protein